MPLVAVSTLPPVHSFALDKAESYEDFYFTLTYHNSLPVIL